MSEAEASDVTEQKFGLRGPDGYHKNPLVAKLQAKLAEKSAALATAAEVGKIILEKNAAMERSLQLAKDQLQRERMDHAALLEELKKVNSEPELAVGQCESDSAEEAALRRQLEKMQVSGTQQRSKQRCGWVGGAQTRESAERGAEHGRHPFGGRGAQAAARGTAERSNSGD